MEKKNRRMCKKILIVIGIILLLFILITVRKIIILSNIDNRVSDYENNKQNIYGKTVITDAENDITTSEVFVKGYIIKETIERKIEDATIGKTVQITYPNERKLFIEYEGKKEVYISNETAPVRGAHIEDKVDYSTSVIINFGYSISLPERILNSIVTSIKTVEVDGKECYELSSLHNSSMLYSEGTKEMQAYVEKETGLPVKTVELIEKDGKTIENVVTYEYKFDVVTAEDMQEPDINQYEVKS